MESLIIQLIAAGVGTLGFAMLYNVRGRSFSGPPSEDFWAGLFMIFFTFSQTVII